MKILSSHLLNFLEYAKIRGLAAEDLAAIEDKLPPDWKSGAATLAAGQFYTALKQIGLCTSDPLFGIKSGNFMSLKLLGLIYQISLRANTIDEAFHYLQSYLHATFPLAEVNTTVSGQLAVVKLNIQNQEDAVNRIILENLLTIISREVRMMADNLERIQITSPFYDDSYPVDWSFSADFTVSFHSIVLKAALNDRTQLHLGLLVPEYLKMIGQVDTGNSFSNKVRITMLSLSDPVLPDIESVCGVLNLTPRTLQRRLLKEEVTFRGITEELKKQICSFLMLHEPYSVSSLSYILGYSESASFIHSFKKWYGASPQKVRKGVKTNDSVVVRRR